MGFIRHLYSGRIGRLHFALLALIMLVVNVMIGSIIGPMAVLMGPFAALLGILLGLAVSVMTLHLYVRRFHDMNMSGWWVAGMIAANFFSVLVGNAIALICYVFLCAMKGDNGANAYGTAPDHHSFADAFLNQ